MTLSLASDTKPPERMAKRCWASCSYLRASWQLDSERSIFWQAWVSILVDTDHRGYESARKPSLKRWFKRKCSFINLLLLGWKRKSGLSDGVCPCPRLDPQPRHFRQKNFDGSSNTYLMPCSRRWRAFTQVVKMRKRRLRRWPLRRFLRWTHDCFGSLKARRMALSTWRSHARSGGSCMRQPNSALARGPVAMTALLVRSGIGMRPTQHWQADRALWRWVTGAELPKRCSLERSLVGNLLLLHA